MIIATLLLMAAQVGPNPSPLELEPLPIPRGKPSVVAAPDAPEPDLATASRTGAIAGNQSIISGDYDGAAELLRQAQDAAIAADEPAMAAEIGLDRARALMMLGRTDEAADLLEAARVDLPGHAHAWVVSSVNARRMGEFEKATTLIAEALSFAPKDPGVSLEAGTLAYMAGDDQSALVHWQGIIDRAPESSEAEFAAQYIESLKATAAFGIGEN
jgi:tetratricopeptide (TPR) repeat protein